jgi:diacylglycerol kinase family enzyme
MLATLVYNLTAGGGNQASPDDLVAWLAQAGFQPVYEATSSEEDLNAVLGQANGLVVAAGGDGTVRAVVTRIIGTGLPLAVVPLGTANNIWNTLASQVPVPTTPQEILAGLKNPIRRSFDIGYVRSPWGEDYFLEAFGYGLYADILSHYKPELGKSVLRSINAFIQSLSESRSHNTQVTLDGIDFSGNCLLFEALNTKMMGPRIKLAPEADPSDGLMDIVRIREDNRAGLLDYLRGLLTEELEELQNVDVSRGRRLEIVCLEPFPIHVDAEVRPKTGDRPEQQNPAAGAPAGNSSEMDARITVEILPAAIELWLPQPSALPVQNSQSAADQPVQLTP